jgi:DNA-binding XRE family transcriptional regulator
VVDVEEEKDSVARLLEDVADVLRGLGLGDQDVLKVKTVVAGTVLAEHAVLERRGTDRRRSLGGVHLSRMARKCEWTRWVELVGQDVRADAREDEFRPYLDEAKKSPEFRNAYEDAQHLQAVMDALVSRRKLLGLTQKQVADKMGVTQSTVSQFETEIGDPLISTLQRYARAVDAEIDMVFTHGMCLFCSQYGTVDDVDPEFQVGCTCSVNCGTAVCAITHAAQRGTAPKTGVELIADERLRQVTQEGYTAEHDDAHSSLLPAAICYAVENGENSDPPIGWPWARRDWKPAGRIRNLVRAGALIAAELDREIRKTGNQ